ncbi:MAG TPA: NADH-quinone oxidoreductase subunit N [Thermodesulfovibrionales bacterium]|nr:NADH-quinone oxidoreductase subunit N [Thermodesulfovibrionales bacterium]
MSTADLICMLPLMLIAAAPVVIMLVLGCYRNHSLTFFLTLAGILLAFLALCGISPMIPHRITGLLIFDEFALFFIGLILASGFVVTFLSYDYLKARKEDPEEFYILLLLATLGSSVIVASQHFASFFIGLEVLSVSLYALIAYTRNELSIEAGVKYLVLAAASAAFLLFGIALIYLETGTMEFSKIGSGIASPTLTPGVLLAGTAMLITGIGFKLALVPFHMWTPDVYEGAPAPVTALVATASKGALFALLMRYALQMDIRTGSPLFLVFAWLSVLSMCGGNLLALFQNNVKRILAYSSIAHLGYLLVAFLSSGQMRVPAVMYYLTAYFVTTLGAFGVVTVLSDKERDMDSLEEYRGLFWRRPWIAVGFSAMLFSLAGIPLTAGFIGKFYLLAAGAEGSLWLLVLILVLNSAIGLFYYLRVIVTMSARLSGEGIPAVRLPLTGSLALVMLAVLLIWLGVFPRLLIDIIHSMAGSI